MKYLASVMILVVSCLYANACPLVANVVAYQQSVCVQPQVLVVPQVQYVQPQVIVQQAQLSYAPTPVIQANVVGYNSSFYGSSGYGVNSYGIGSNAFIRQRVIVHENIAQRAFIRERVVVRNRNTFFGGNRGINVRVGGGRLLGRNLGGINIRIR